MFAQKTHNLMDNEMKVLPFSYFLQLSKDVKMLRDFEEGLLKQYQRYLQILEATVEGILLFNLKL